MKTTRSLLPALLLIACHIAGAPGLRAAEVDRETDHAALRKLRDQVATAINNLDAKALAPCFAKQFAFTTVNQVVLTNLDQCQAFFDKMFRAKDAPMTGMKTEPAADILTRFIDQNTGVCYGSTKDSYTLKHGQVVTMNLRWSATVVKEDGQWKVALAHAGTDFLDNPVLTRLSSLWRAVALAAGVGGLVVGLVLGRVTARRKNSTTA